jgi:hypothetical protein
MTLLYCFYYVSGGLVVENPSLNLRVELSVEFIDGGFAYNVHDHFLIMLICANQTLYFFGREVFLFGVLEFIQ